MCGRVGRPGWVLIWLGSLITVEEDSVHEHVWESLYSMNIAPCLLQKAGQQKLAAMHKVSSFRRGILDKEWEHKRLKMEIQNQEEQLHNLESTKVSSISKLCYTVYLEDQIPHLYQHEWDTPLGTEHCIY